MTTSIFRKPKNPSIISSPTNFIPIPRFPACRRNMCVYPPHGVLSTCPRHGYQSVVCSGAPERRGAQLSTWTTENPPFPNRKYTLHWKGWMFHLLLTEISTFNQTQSHGGGWKMMFQNENFKEWFSGSNLDSGINRRFLRMGLKDPAKKMGKNTYDVKRLVIPKELTYPLSSGTFVSTIFLFTKWAYGLTRFRGQLVT